MASRTREQLNLTDPRVIRALSHPARLVVIEELYSGRVATSTELARLAGLTPSAMSYHLRALARYGIVRRVSATSDGRERPWRAAAKGISVSSLPTKAAQAAGSVLLANLLASVGSSVEAYLSAQNDLPEPWQDAAMLDNESLYLTAAQSKELIAELEGVLDRFRPRARRRPQARRVRITLGVTPEVD